MLMFFRKTVVEMAKVMLVLSVAWKINFFAIIYHDRDLLGY